MEEESSAGGGGDAAKPAGRGGGGGDLEPSPKVSTRKGKSCKGCLYYSSLLKADARSPICIGLGRTLQKVPGYIVGQSEREAAKDDHNLSDFKYACVGYSVFLNNKDNSTDKRENRANLPVCAGIQLLVDRRTSTVDHAPAHVHNKEDGTVRSQPRANKPAHSLGEEFFGRFRRNAGLVGSGVVRNLHRMGNYIKQNVDDVMYPYRRRPK